MLAYIYNEIIYRPLFNLLVWFYNVIPGHDIGVAIVLLTLFVRLLLYGTNSRSIKSQRQLQEIQPKIKEIQQKYKEDKETQAKKLMELYQKNKINPLSGCLPLLIQLPILIALYQVFMNGFQDASLSMLYQGYVYNPTHLNPISLNFVNLSVPNVYLAFIAGILQYYQTKMLMGTKEDKAENKEKNKEKTAADQTQDFAKIMNKQMIYIMPVMTFMFAQSFPSGLALYWAVTTAFAIIQQYLIMKKQNKAENINS
ncbi:MAG: membrane protein insertase YidC [Candidatus Paceibacterota bacterium]|jgi:YidC/Oxa1 family membrane protein insertase